MPPPPPPHPQVCFFAGINIAAGSELSYDYGRQYVMANLGGVCKCGADCCCSREAEAEQAQQRAAGGSPAK